MQPKRHGSFSNSQRGRTQNLIPDLNEEPPNLEVIRRARLHRQIPTIFHPYISISSLQDVKPDGNCGFRSVALGLGLHEDHWPRIRSDLVRELDSHRHQYMSIFGTKGYNQIYRSVRLAGEWMEMPATGLVIASTYNKVVVSLSNDGGCATSFPLWSDPPQSDSNEIIVIAHVNGDHYIRVALREGFPLPITHPLWVTYRSNIASEWGDRYVSRQNDFREYYFRDPESNGRSTSFWNDLWIGDSCFRYKFPRLYALDINKECTVADKMVASFTSSFRREVRGGAESLQLTQILDLLGTVILSNMEDRWIWDLNGDGEFCVKDVRNLLDVTFLPKADSPTRWIKTIPIKVNIFAWKVSLDRLPTRSNLARRGVLVPSSSCLICNVSDEDLAHLLFRCDLAIEVTRLVYRWWNLVSIPTYLGFFGSRRC
ncbi:RNA-directed DNA polymerase, eukaryota [Tanacetum coccineum]